EEALKVLKDAAAQAPKAPMPLLGLGIAYMAAKDLKTASDTFRKASNVDITNVTSLNLLANAYIDLNLPELAEETLQQALKRAPQSVTTKVNLAYLRIQKMEFEAAVKMLTEAIATDDKCAEAHYVLGLAYDHQ